MSKYQINSGVSKGLWDYYRDLAVQAGVPVSRIGHAVYDLYSSPKYAPLIVKRARELDSARKEFPGQQIEKEIILQLQRQIEKQQLQMDDLRLQLGLD